MDKQNYVELVQNAVFDEFESFKKKELLKSKKEIFEDNYQIRFYDEVSNFLECIDDGALDNIHWKCLNEDSGSILNKMYNYYLNSEYASINNTDDLLDLITDYNKSYHHEILYKNLEAQ